MAELDPSIILSAGQINDPGRLAQMAQEQFRAQQMGQTIRNENMLKRVMAQPGSFTSDGQVSKNALAQIMRFDPLSGMKFAQQNREAQMDQYKLQAQQFANQLSQSELGKAKLAFGSEAYVAGVKAYDQAIAEHKSPAEAASLATRARNDILSRNGGQLSEEEERTMMATPFDIDRARVNAGFNEAYAKQQNTDREFGLESRRLTDEEAQQAWQRKHGDQEFGLARDRFAWEKTLPQTVGQGSYVFDPKTGGFVDPSTRTVEPYTGGLTPRARNGGDNSDRVVDQKMGFIANRLGVDIDTPLTPGQLRAFRDAYVITEGAKGNNVGNLRVPGSNAFQQFNSRAAGTAAIDQQIARDFNRGQTTIRQLIEGVPAGGARTAAGGGMPPARAAGGMSAEAIDFAAQEGLAMGGRVPPGFARNKAAQSAIETRMAEIAKFEGRNPRDYMATGAGITADTRSLAGLQKQVDAMTAFERTTLANGKAAISAALQAGGPETFRAWRKFVLEGRRQTNDPKVRALDIAIQTVASEYGKAIGGGANGNAALTDSARHEAQSMLSSADSPQVLAQAIQQMGIDMENRRQAYQGQLSDIRGRISGNQQANAGGKPSVSNW